MPNLGQETQNLLQICDLSVLEHVGERCDARHVLAPAAGQVVVGKAVEYNQHHQC